MESTNKNIKKLNAFISLTNTSLEADELVDKEILRKDICINLIKENKDFFSQITKEESFYFVNNLGFASSKNNKTEVASKLILINQNFLPIIDNQDIVEMVNGFRLFHDSFKVNLIQSLAKSKKTDFFKNSTLNNLCWLLISDLEITSDVAKVNFLEVLSNQNPDLFRDISYPSALVALLEELNISSDLEKYEAIKIISTKNTDIFSTVKDIYDACFIVTDRFKVRSNSIKNHLLKIITESNPEMLNQIESVDDLLQVIRILRIDNSARDICQFCELLIANKPEIIGSIDNIKNFIQQVGFTSNEDKELFIAKAISLQKNNQDKAELIKDAFKSFLFLSYQPYLGADMIKESIAGFSIDESADLINGIIYNQSVWSKGELLSSILLANVVRDKEVFLKIDLSDINNQDSQRIIEIARSRINLSSFDLLRFSKLINCDKYSSIMDLLQKTGADGIFKSSVIHFINSEFNPDNDNDFDINQCKAINFLNYAQLMGFDINLHKIFKSHYFKELGRGFISRTPDLPASHEDLMRIAQTLRITVLDRFIQLSDITTIFREMRNEIRSMTAEDVVGLSISQKAKDILGQAFTSSSSITMEQSTEFFKEILDDDNSLDLSQDNGAKLFIFLRRNHKDLCALLKSPEGVVNLNNAIYSVADGCIANIGNQMKMIVLQELIKSKDAKNSQEMLKIYQALIDGSVLPLINSRADFIGPEQDITSGQYMELYHTATTDFFRQVALQFKGSAEVHGILSKEMGDEKATQLMIKCGVCDEYLSEFDEEKAKLLGAYKAITAVLKKKDIKKIFNHSDEQIKEFCSSIKDAEKLIVESEQTPATTFTPLTGLRNLRVSATNFFQRFANR